MITSDSEAAQPLPLPEETYWGPTTFSFGGASAAMASNHDSMLTNPAGLIYYSGRSSLGGSYLTRDSDRSQWTVSLVDGSQGGLIGGFLFQMADYHEASRQTYDLAAAYKTPYGSVGASGIIHRMSGVPEGKGWHFTGNLGLIVPVSYGLALGAYAHAFLDRESDTQFPPSVHLAAMYTYSNFIRISFESDRKYNVGGQEWNYSLGGDSLWGQYFTIRGGYRWDKTATDSFWSVGAGVLAQKIELTGVFLRTTEGSPSNSYGIDANLKF